MATRKHHDAPPPAAPNDLFDGDAPRKAAPETCPECGGAHKPSEPHTAPVAATKALVPQVEAAPGVFAAPTAATGMTARTGPLGDEMEYGRESAAVAVGQKARVQARIIQALQRPRKVDDFRITLLKDCQRPTFAETAIFKKPVGRELVNGQWRDKTIEGLSIRFAETALARWGNVDIQTVTLYEDDEKRRVLVTVLDLETNAEFGSDFVVLKRVEKAKLKQGQTAISERYNNRGEKVFLVEATDDELNTRINAFRSKTIRNEGLRLIPPDIKEEAMALCRLTRDTQDAKAPDLARKKIADAFARIGVMPSHLCEYLGVENLDQTSPAQVADLREVFTAIDDGEVTWQDFMSARSEDVAPAEEQTAPGSSRVESLKERARAKAEARKAGVKS